MSYNIHDRGKTLHQSDAFQKPFSAVCHLLEGVPYLQAVFLIIRMGVFDCEL